MFKNSRLTERLTIAVVAASLGAFGLAGCGGGGGSSSPATSPFAGTYNGTFSTSNPQSGTLHVTAGTNGNLTGTGHNNTTGQDETVSGSVSNSGTASVTFVYPSFTATASGQVAFASNGHLDGTLTQSSGGSVTIDLIKQ